MAKILLAREETEARPIVVTVNADIGFVFPNTAFYSTVAKEGLGLPDLGLGATAGQKLSQCYLNMMGVLALPFSPHGSYGLQKHQVNEMNVRRFSSATFGSTQMEKPATGTEGKLQINELC